MLRLASYDIVFQEVPGEVSLALNLSGCPNRCLGCHSPHLQEEIGLALDEYALGSLLDRYASAITCVCFMGGDAEPLQVERLVKFVRSYEMQKWGTSSGSGSGTRSRSHACRGNSLKRLKTAWYSGRPQIPSDLDLANFDYIKLGPYIAELGGLDSLQTNQRFYKNDGRALVNITESFHKV